MSSHPRMEPSGSPPPPERTYELSDLLDALPEDEDYDLDLIEKAHEFAERAHEGQVRSSGTPYIQHCIAVSCILAELGLDTTTIVAGLLHDVLEDTPVTESELESEFGKQVAEIVDGVTKLVQHPVSTVRVRETCGELPPDAPGRDGEATSA